MDSGNSDSLQSSSGGDDQEYDSRAANNFHVGSFSGHHHHQPPQNTTIAAVFDPLANYFNPISRQQPQPPPLSSHQNSYHTAANSLVNLDMLWSNKTLIRSDHPNMLPSNSFSFDNHSPVVNFPFATAEQGGASVSNTTSPVVAPPPDQPAQPVRNPKKRSRASRRAPTTVLTTDTSNFRAMVQEFTGIPAPPFTSSSSSVFPRNSTRFDLFSTPLRSSSSATTNTNPNPLALDISLPPYLRRPFPQKIQQPVPLSQTTSSSHLLSGLATTSSSNLFQQNSILSSLLQSSQKYPLENSAILGTKDHATIPLMNMNTSHEFKNGGGNFLEEFGFRSQQYGHVNNTALTGLPNLISSEQAAAAPRNESIPASWGGLNANNNAVVHGGGGDKLPEHVASTGGGEGIVESWMCSSD